jgi:hypothetical protein
MIEEDVNVELLPLGNQNEGHEYVVAVRFRAVNADVALKIADGIQEQLPSAGVSPWCPVTHS